jgi:hypothetical protein
MLFYYESPILGTVKWTDVTWASRESLTEDNKQIIKGIIRNRKDSGDQPIEIDSKLISQLDNLDIPYEFDAKAQHFLKYLFDHGGKTYKSHTIDSSVDNAITYSSRDEFEGIIRFLTAEGFVSYEMLVQTDQMKIYHGLIITREGMKEVEEGIPKMPLFGLVNQKIYTGDEAIDSKIEHARALFFDEYHTLDKMRSACETLIFVMEPLREELETLFNGDTEMFFNIVNNFTIRHNKRSTRNIEYPEQLEWIFYSLLNTINTYIKLKKRL